MSVSYHFLLNVLMTRIFKTIFFAAVSCVLAASNSLTVQARQEQVIQQTPKSGGSDHEADGEGHAKQFVGIERVFSTLRFDRPVYLTGAGDQSQRIFVVEQAGVIRWFSKQEEQPTSDIFLDIREWISRRGNEEGLIGFAFHPEFKNNGYVYCHFSSKRDKAEGQRAAPNILSRFKISEDPNKVDVDSELVLMKIQQPYENHNGGSLEFGKDGYLYLSLGDGGYRDDPHGNGQNVSTLLGSILRIDVDRQDEGKQYSIPTDNPFINVQDARPEIYAIGLRNVWRFSFDRKTGDLWAADVGQDRTEEVNIIRKGGNYGWNRYEAKDDFQPKTAIERSELAIERHDQPVAFYGRQWGGSITGGYVYRGKKFPELDGSYFFGDYMTGNLWRTKKDNNGEYQTELARRTGRSIASFGEDDDGEVYLLSFDGGIYQVVTTDKPENTFEDWPKKISETGLFTSTRQYQVADHLIPYEVNAPFWSDDAEKKRYFILPEGKTLGYRQEGSWEVPVGATIVKNFLADDGRRKRMFETRLIKRTTEGWESATYVWDKNGDAELLPNGKQFEFWNRGIRSWHAPSASECSSCHVDASGYVLGLNTAQLNRSTPASGDKNQIVEWAQKGLLDLPRSFDASSAPRYCSLMDESFDFETRARVWLDVNCAMCHQPLGPGNANIDLRHATTLDKTGTVGVRPAQNDMGIKDGLLIAPGEPDKSLLIHRIETLSEGRMPSIGSNQVDRNAVKLLTEWVKSMNP